jgi:hypothetical protein
MEWLGEKEKDDGWESAIGTGIQNGYATTEWVNCVVGVAWLGCGCPGGS